jgi:hypothetical protein
MDPLEYLNIRFHYNGSSWEEIKLWHMPVVPWHRHSSSVTIYLFLYWSIKLLFLCISQGSEHTGPAKRKRAATSSLQIGPVSINLNAHDQSSQASSSVMNMDSGRASTNALEPSKQIKRKPVPRLLLEDWVEEQNEEASASLSIYFLHFLVPDLYGYYFWILIVNVRLPMRCLYDLNFSFSFNARLHMAGNVATYHNGSIFFHLFNSKCETYISV